MPTHSEIPSPPPPALAASPLPTISNLPPRTMQRPPYSLERAGNALEVFAHSRRVVNINIDHDVSRHAFLHAPGPQLICRSRSANRPQYPADLSPAAFSRRISASTIRGFSRTISA